MKTKHLFLTMFVLSASPCFSQAPNASGQARYEARSGQNSLQLAILNRVPWGPADLKVRFAGGQPSWLLSTGEAVGRVKTYKDEKSLLKEGTRLEVPFLVAPSGYMDGEVKLELLNGSELVGTFTVFLDFPDVGGSSSNSTGTSSMRSNEVSLESGLSIPKEYALHQNYPNPFNPSTIIQFELPAATNVVLKIYDLLGREVKTLVNEERLAGTYRVVWDGTNHQGEKAGTGMYIYRLFTGTSREARRMLLLE